MGLLVYDLQGRLVATLEERRLSKDKYEAVWEPDAHIGNGHYFVALKMEDMQVHWISVVKQG